MVDDLTFPFNVKRGWQPIESAPRDGRLLLCKAGNKRSFEGFYGGMGNWYSCFDDTMIVHPTHWMPLPAPPEGGK